MDLNSARRSATGLLLVVSVASSLALASPAHAEECSRNPAAIGTSRVISIDPAALRQVGTAQYAQTLPLRDHEIVLSFDDGPSPATTAKALDALAAGMRKSKFFYCRGAR
jgi:hypothetical protein